MRVEFTGNFDKNFSKFDLWLQKLSKKTIEEFIDSYTHKQYPKSLRAHKCGPFLSISITMNYRIYVLPIPDGIRFVFIGDHKDAENYLKRKT